MKVTEVIQTAMIDDDEDGETDKIEWDSTRKIQKQGTASK